MTQSVELEAQEWQQVISALAMANPVLVKISTQLAQQQERVRSVESDPSTSTQDRRQGFMHPGNSKEPHHGL